MTIVAEGNQIVLIVFTRAAAEPRVMDLQICHRAAQLASPAISPQYLFAELPVIFIF